MTFLKEYMEEEIPKNYSIAQKRALFFFFVDFNDPSFGDELKAKVSPTVTQQKPREFEPVFQGAKAAACVLSHPCWHSSSSGGGGGPGDSAIVGKPRAVRPRASVGK